LQAFFAPLLPRDDVSAGDARAKERERVQRATWESTTQGMRGQMEALVAGKREELRRYALTKFRAEIQQAVLTPDRQRTPYQRQIAAMAEQQLDRAGREAPAKLSAEGKKRYRELERKMAAVAP